MGALDFAPKSTIKENFCFKILLEGARHPSELDDIPNIDICTSQLEGRLVNAAFIATNEEIPACA